MSSTLGSVDGRGINITVARSDGGVELFRHVSNSTEGTYDALTPDAARGLASLLNAAADSHDKHVANKLKGV